MVGNDLVFFNTRTQHKETRLTRFLAKTFTAQEREVLKASRFAFMQALIWSAKEAAFKVFMQQHPLQERFYAPKKFEVFIARVERTSATGEVHYQEQRYAFTSEVHADYLHTIACPDQSMLTEVYTQISPRTKKEARSMQHPVLGKLHFKNNTRGIPEAFTADGRAKASTSVSHDGPLQALAFLVI